MTHWCSVSLPLTHTSSLTHLKASTSSYHCLIQHTHHLLSKSLCKLVQTLHSYSEHNQHIAIACDGYSYVLDVLSCVLECTVTSLRLCSTVYMSINQYILRI